ncbi:zinc finger protein ush isoform X2 [Drosophila elegans]|uniref:zinc finger protein ush isoform X2 n=1 Tax=Drosophila elegans TaxID=30023 RepID=UPI0007E89401|nr:zinc finger protein ush isoform X2 [Drosophila elegans]
MSRRKQSNPKPLNKGDCSDTTEEMTVDSRDSKDLTAQEMGVEKQEQMEDELEDQLEDARVHQTNNNNNNNNDEGDEDGDFDQPEEATAEQDQDLGETEMDHQSEEQDEAVANSPSTPPRSPCSSPQLIPKLEQPSTPPSEAEPSPCPSPKFPKVRLNALLASDPALKPDAKELTLPDTRLLAPPPLIKPENQVPPEVVVEPLLKPARFMCLPCGIAFSSPSTLEAHQAYYCSHRIKDTDDAGSDKSGAGGSAAGGSGEGAGSSSAEPPAKMARTGKQYGCTQCSYSADKKVSLNRHMRMHQTSPAAPTLASLPSLLQNGIPPPPPPVGGTPTSLEDSSSQQTDRYCSHCDIRFNNIKTYRAHKQHYCSSRRPEGQLTPKPDVSPGGGSGGPSSTGGSGVGVSVQAAVPGKLSPQTTRNKTPTPAMVAVAAAAAAAAAAASLQATPHPHPPFLALPTHPIIIVPCSLIRAASFIPGPLPTPNSGIVNPETTCFTVDNGTIKPLATALIGASLEPERPSAPSSAAEATEAKSSPPEPMRKEAGGSRESAPLDLSLRRSPISLSSLSLRQRHLRTALLDVEEALLGGAGKENVETPRTGGSVTPEQIVCAPSLPSSPSMSPSPKRRAISPRSSGAGSASSMSPPGLNVAVPHLLDMRPMLPADFGLTESLLAKTNPELALKLAAAAAAAAVAGGATLPAPTGGGNPGSGGGSSGGGSQQPQIYVKKGVSKCMECNIVFCKYENYLAHKQHYCSARSQEGSANEVDAKSAVSPSNPGGAGGSGAGGAEAALSSVETTPVAYQQLICAACGIKYTSLDNLRAHQNYYCPKGGAATAVPAVTSSDPGQLSLAKEKCGKCKTVHEMGLPCPAPASNSLAASSTNNSQSSASNSLNKCPVCGVVSPTAALAKKHMEMHGTVKAYRCSICQYKGNTLRGMRTHIRTHFDKKTSDVNEEHYMTCIFQEEEASTLSQAELPPSAGGAGASSAAGVHDSMDHPSQMFNCDYCNYASTYKGNVLRHMKLMHPHVAVNSPSISPDTRDQEATSNPTPNQHSNSEGSNGEAASFLIKSEPLDPQPPTLNLVHENNNSPIATPHIKAEPMDMVVDVAPGGGLAPPMASPLGNSSVAAAAAAAVAAAEVMKKYCSTCDISFNYVKTYLAHKQFYCKNKPIRPEANDSPSPNHLGVAVGGGVGVGLMAGHGQQKNKENLQEAAI